jgi:AcrR family transcriptional regulator
MTPAKPKGKARGRTPAPRRSPLTPEKIAAAALRIADQRGVEAISTRSLGEELGYSHMSVYLQFPSQEELLKAAFDLALSDAPKTVVRSHGWQERARAVCAAIRRTLMDHPACYELARRFPGRGIGIWDEDMSIIASEAGYSGDDAAALARILTQVSIDLTSSSAVRRSWEKQQGFEKFARPEEQESFIEHARFSDEDVFNTVIESLIDSLERGIKLPAPAHPRQPKTRRKT